MIKRSEHLVVGDVLPDGRVVSEPVRVEGLTVRVPVTWRGGAAPDRVYHVGRQLVVNIPDA